MYCMYVGNPTSTLNESLSFSVVFLQLKRWLRWVASAPVQRTNRACPPLVHRKASAEGPSACPASHARRLRDAIPLPRSHKRNSVAWLRLVDAWLQRTKVAVVPIGIQSRGKERAGAPRMISWQVPVICFELKSQSQSRQLLALHLPPSAWNSQ